MLKTLALTLALGAGAALIATSSNAMPLASGLSADSGVTLVREGCGPGMQYSERLRRCTRDSARAQMKDAVRADRCPPGRHWSHRAERCVRN
jgi:hypothetical protein